MPDLDNVVVNQFKVGSNCGAKFDKNEPAPHFQFKHQSSHKFLLQDWIPRGALIGIFGDDSSGKDIFALYGIMRPIITGEPWFNGSRAEKPKNVLWCHTRDDGVITENRIRNYKLPINRLMLPFSNEQNIQLNLGSMDHLKMLEGRISQSETPLVLIDSLATSHNRNENDASRMSDMLNSLAEVAGRTGATIAFTQDTRKKHLSLGKELTLADCRGSSAIPAATQCMFGVDSPDPDSSWRRVRVFKESFGVNHAPFWFRADADGVEFGPSPEIFSTKDQEVLKWLKKELEPGIKYPSKVVRERAISEGISRNRLLKAGSQLGVKIERMRNKAGNKITNWTWELPIS